MSNIKMSVQLIKLAIYKRQYILRRKRKDKYNACNRLIKWRIVINHKKDCYTYYIMGILNTVIHN